MTAYKSFNIEINCETDVFDAMDIIKENSSKQTDLIVYFNSMLTGISIAFYTAKFFDLLRFSKYELEGISREDNRIMISVKRKQ